jgi:hypothetical protein
MDERNVMGWRVSMTAALAGRTALRISVAMFLIATAHSQPGEPADDYATMQSVALLFHGPYSERPYTLTATTGGALALEEVGGGPVRFVLRRVPGKRCVFLATHDDHGGLNVEQLDFEKFDGSHQLWEACGAKGTILERMCSYSLHFKSSPRGFCQYGFSNPQFDLVDIPFPDEACRPFGMGGREKQFYAKYRKAFDLVFQQCMSKDAERSNRVSNDCIVRIPAFVQELDKLLASDPRTIHPVKDLIRSYFPVEGCNIQQAIKTSRNSRFFSHVSEEETYYVIAFDSKGLAGLMDPGLHVQINLLKASGNSWLPSANINQ